MNNYNEFITMDKKEIKILPTKMVIVILFIFFCLMCWTFSIMILDGYSVLTSLVTVLISFLPIIFITFFAISICINKIFVRKKSKS